MKPKDIQLILVGITFVILSILINDQWGKLVHGDDPFFFPEAFALAAIYGWWSRNYIYSFLVGFFSIPMMVYTIFPYLMPFIFITNLLGLTDYNLFDILFFCAFGIVSGLIGVGFVKLHKIKRRE